MNSIKIVYILGTLEIGGTERQFIELVQGLDRQRFHISVLSFECVGPLRTIIEATNIPFTCLDFSGLQGKFHLITYRQLYHLFRDMVHYLKREHPQIVQTYLFWTNVYGSIAAKLAGVPVIVTGRRGIMETSYKTFHRQWLQNLSNVYATAILTNSHVVKQECLQRDIAVSEEKIQVIHNGIRSELYCQSFEQTAKRQELSIPAKSAVIGMIATIHPNKRHEDMLRAIPLIKQWHPQTVFVFVGRDGGALESLEKLASKLGVQASVRFVGERRDIPEILAVFDILVLLSEGEGLSNALLEGMAAGKPIVATDVAGNPEVVIHERTGLLIPSHQPNRLADAIVRLLDNPDLRTQFGSAGRDRVQTHFRVERMVSQTESLYQYLVATRLEGSEQ